MLLIHIDDLEIVNDCFGYSWGNEALAQAAAALRDSVRQGDIVGRISGNHFGVFLPGADETNARSVADRIHDSVTAIGFFPTGVRYPLSIRAGAVIVADRAKFDDLLKTAVGTLEMTRGQDREWIRGELSRRGYDQHARMFPLAHDLIHALALPCRRGSYRRICPVAAAFHEFTP